MITLKNLQAKSCQEILSSDSNCGFWQKIYSLNKILYRLNNNPKYQQCFDIVICEGFIFKILKNYILENKIQNLMYNKGYKNKKSKIFTSILENLTKSTISSELGIKIRNIIMDNFYIGDLEREATDSEPVTVEPLDPKLLKDYIYEDIGDQFIYIMAAVSLLNFVDKKKSILDPKSGKLNKNLKKVLDDHICLIRNYSFVYVIHALCKLKVEENKYRIAILNGYLLN